LSGRSDPLAQRRVIAAAIGAYAGITIAALLVGLELGIQPRLWSTNGVPDYSPYGFASAIPAMLAAHAFGASFVEAAITALSLAYLQRAYPELVLRREPRRDDGGTPARAINPWLPALGFVAVSLAIIFVAGLVRSGGDLRQWGGLDWSSVDWGVAGGTVLVSVIVSAVVLPALFILLRGRSGTRTVAMVFAALIIWAPIGLIAPGGAFAEDQSATPEQVSAALQAQANGDSTLFDALPDVNKVCRCVPNKINNVNYSSHTV